MVDPNLRENVIDPPRLNRINVMCHPRKQWSWGLVIVVKGALHAFSGVVGRALS